MSYLSKFLILLGLGCYTGFMDYLDNPERYEVFTQAKISINQEEETFEDVTLKTKEDSSSYEEMIGDKRFSFDYDLKRYLLDKEIVEVNAKITNHSNEDVYFYYESCYGIKDLFEIKYPNLGIKELILCFTTIPMVQLIPKNSTFEYKFEVPVREDFDEMNINFRFSESTELGGINQFFLLEGKPTKIQKIKGRNTRLETETTFE